MDGKEVMNEVKDRDTIILEDGTRIHEGRIWKPAMYFAETTFTLKNGDCYLVVNPIGKKCYDKLQAKDKDEIDGLVRHSILDLKNTKDIDIKGEYHFTIMPKVICGSPKEK